MEVTRLFDILERNVVEFPKDDAICGKENGVWTKYSSRQYLETVNNISYGLLQLGIQKGDCIATITPNRPEWNLLDMAIMQIGAVHVAIYPTISESDYDYILHHAAIKMVFVFGWELLRKINNIIEGIPELNDKVYTLRNLRGYRHLNEVIELGRANPCPQYLKEIKDSITPHDIVSIVYTSGTTGNPKGVMLSHENFLTNVRGVLPIIPTPNGYNRVLSFLPLCHVYERMMNYVWQYLGIPIYYAENLAKIADNMQELNPTIFTTVPRLLEKIYDKILAKGRALKGIKRKIFFWANDVALEFDYNKGKAYHRKLAIARKLVLNQWKAATGTSMRVIVSGGAALQPKIAKIFWAMGVSIIEGYGLSETSPVIAVSDFFKGGLELGAVGPILPGTLCKIADDGEILTKGKHVMKGYYHDEEKTRETIDEDGWLHTGDLGTLTNGRLRVTGRKKEMFKTAFGKYVVPTLIETKFAEDVLIDNIMVVGENKQFAAALIVPNFADLRSWCTKKGIQYTTNEEMVKNKEVNEKFKKIVNEYNKFFGETEKVKRFLLIGHEWSIQTDELTPTLKLKRNKLLTKYSEQIEELFN